eukprot:scaffold5681_cov377-Prasinococcus_capsulatus_cf.AAC.11
MGKWHDPSTHGRDLCGSAAIAYAIEMLSSQLVIGSKAPTCMRCTPTTVGSLADKMGRKKACMVYVVTYVGSCVTKHWSNYNVLMLGRVFGGIATSLLFSSFESWLVAEHFKRGYEGAWLSGVFSKAVFLGNGVAAIVAGLIANTLVHSMDFGPVAPFDAAIVVLVLGGIMIATTWTENFGDNSATAPSLVQQFRNAFNAIKTDPKVGVLGAVQSLFEASMYTFVFLWTPALSPNDEDIPHGRCCPCGFMGGY